MHAPLRSIALLFPFLAGALCAQVNDNCSGAIDIDLNAPVDCPDQNININFNNGTVSTNPPFCDAAGSQIRDLWYRFYSANNTTVTIYMSSSQSAHLGFGVYTSCGGAAYACLTDVDGYVEIPVAQNTHYYLQVYTLVNFDPTNNGIICMHWNTAPPPPPANDECAGAVLLNVGASCTYTSGNSSWATSSPVNTICNPTIIAANNDDVWYRFTAPAATTVITVDGDGTSTTGYDPILILAYATGCAGPFNVVACSNTTGPGGVETITTDVLLPGATYYVRVYDRDAASPQPGTFGICVYAPDFLGVDDAPRVEESLLTPNGEPGGYTVRSPFATAAVCELRVLDAMGRIVHTEGAQLAPAAPHHLQLAALRPGTYLLVVQHEGRVRTQRFVHF